MNNADRPRHTDFYAPRRLSAFGQGYSFFVKTLKFALPVAAIVIIGALITRLSEDPQQKQKISLLPSEEKTTPGMIEMMQAKYEGLDDEGRPYTVTADKASRAMNAPDSVVFENPVADITLQDKTWVAVKAKAGSFDRTAESLHLNDNVQIFHDSGYEIQLQNIEIDLKQKTAVTASPVLAHGPMGTITAQNMAVKNQGNLIIFGGPATLTIFRLSVQKERG